MTTKNEMIANAEITELVTSVRSKWVSGVEDRLELGKLFSDLRKAVEKYTRTSKDKKKVSYNEAVRLTGVPRGTAELYRGMFEICDKNKIDADVFVILAEAGFNLARDLNHEIAATGIFADNPKLKSVEYLLGLSAEETAKLVAGLRKDYGNEEAQEVSIDSLKSDIASMKQEQSESNKVEYKQFLEKEIEKKTATIHSKMLSSLRNIASAFASLLGRDKNWADSYVEQTKENAALTERRYQEAVAFAQKATFLTEVEKTTGSVKPSGKQSKKA
jgi:hypothetical protein